ncbi:X-ray repair cross-complementing protein 5-like isoform X2 [Penaeus japonicus]|uniref:X-ray repair cross-complementing protein 5-like isoform X2 n=1 Tax=Penaeus japonicus TaxID=27405 RepID=UPI001C711C14|nr:X-ray repair cross-complementing protein 5-like isoform X2 [Penaeus japonicus]
MPPRAQPGEGIVVALDVGPGVRASTETSFFSQAKKCLTNILQRKMFAEKCKDQVGIVLFGTDGTDNNLASADQYQHITVLREIMTVDWDMMNEVDQLPYGKTSADWLDALVVAMDLLHDPDGSRFSSKKIVLMTDFSGEFSDDQASKIIAGLNNSGIELSVIGPEIMDDDNSDDDMDGPGSSNGRSKNNSTGNPINWNGKPKSAVQLAGEALITRIVSEVDGIICSFDEAIPQLIFFQKKSAGSANWNTVLDIGPDFQIAITGKIKIKHATVPTWKKMHAHDESAAIISETSYHRHDDAQTAVDEAEVIMGYKYGTTLVPFSDEDAQMKFSSDSPRALSVLGFTRSSNVRHNRRAGDQVLVVTGREGDETAAVALSALIQALVELDMVAITRRIYNKNSNPVMGALFPEVTKKYECFIWIPLPFQEDIRLFTFPSLQRLTEKLTEKEKQAMDDLISNMDLSGHDDDDEELEPSTVLNPQLQHYYNVLTHRAIHPHDPLPPPADHVLNILKPPESVHEGRDRVGPALQAAFPTKRIVKKTKDKADLFASDDQSSKKIKLDGDDSISAGDLTRPQVTKVTSTTPVQDFMALLGGEAPNFNLICSQLGDVIMQLLNSIGGGGAATVAITTKILDCLENFRRESCGIDPAVYNKFITAMKDTVTTRSLNEFWSRVKEGNYGLISSNENMRSSVSAEEVEAFWKMEDQMEASVPKQEANDDMEDLLDDL